MEASTIEKQYISGNKRLFLKERAYRREASGLLKGIKKWAEDERANYPSEETVLCNKCRRPYKRKHFGEHLKYCGKPRL